MNEKPNSPDNNQANPSPYDYSHLRESGSKSHWYGYPEGEGQDPQAEAPKREQPTPTPSPKLSESAALEATLQNPRTGPSAPTVSSASRAASVPHYSPPPTPPAPPLMPPGSPARARSNQRQHRRAAGLPDNWAWVVIAMALFGVTIIGSMLLFLVIGVTKDRGDNNTALASRPMIEPTSEIYTDSSGALEGSNSLELATSKWDGRERFTILLMGLDKRPDESGSVFRTDSMILISLDPVSNSIGLLSIPRDTYVEVPYAGLHRVNAAYVIGELETPGGGPTLAMQTVQYNLGIRVNEYVTVDFQSVIGIIDALGGIEVNVERSITDYAYPTWDYGTEVFSIQAGVQRLDGETALKYARTRHASDDIDRARRQQQVIFGVRDRVTSLGAIDDLIREAPFLYAQMRNGINTGLSFDQMIQLALWAMDVPRENIRSGVVSWEYLSGYRTPTGGSVLIPNRSALGGLMVEVFGANYNQ